MLIIILGIIISFLIGLVLINIDLNLCAGVCTIGIIASIFTGIFFPTKYGERELLSQTELVTLSNSTISKGNGLLYVSISGENAYTYRYEVDTDLGTETSKNYITDTISSSDGYIIESEDPNCKTPVLLEYRTKSKMTIWSFGVGGDIMEYVFYVPEGTIQKEVKLK